jgi:hypothetical protein
MPIYENIALPYSIAPGESATPIVSTDNVQGGLPFKSERVALVRGLNTTPQHLSAELQFSGTPGAYTWFAAHRSLQHFGELRADPSSDSDERRDRDRQTDGVIENMVQVSYATDPATATS